MRLIVSFYFLLSFILTGCGNSTYPGYSSQGGFLGPPGASAPGGNSFAGWNPPFPTAAGENSTFSYIQQNILIPRCESCHSAAIKSGSFVIDSYQEVMSGAAVVPGDPMHSWLYIETSLKYMPAYATPLSQDEINEIYSWIEGGAKNN